MADADPFGVDTMSAPLLVHARRIGDRLCETAIVTPDRRHANWLGRRDIVDDALTARFSVRTGALGPELYAGSAGIAFFLTGLFAATAEARYAEVAAAALRRSVAYLRATALPLHPFSFFAGHAGVLGAVERLLARYPDDELAADAAWLGAVIAAASLPAQIDIIAGSAGGILALLDLGRLEQAQRCGEALCDAAIWDGDRCSWRVDPASDGRVAPALAGLAHGGSGMALALLALHRAAPDDRLLATARGALAYTDDLFNEQEASWIDTRAPHRLSKGAAEGRFQSGWCHGNAGILLVRQLAAAVDLENAATHARYAAVAAKAAARTMRDLADRPGLDATLCHGVLGHGEALATYDPAFRGECVEIAHRLIRRYPGADGWPSGVNAGGDNPSLMIGMAGIGSHLLRLHRPDALSPVLSLFVR